MRGSMLTFSAIVTIALVIGVVAFLLPGLTTLAQRPAEVTVPPTEQTRLLVPLDVPLVDQSPGLPGVPGEVRVRGLLDEDPERAAEEFVERTRHEVDDAIRALTEEAEQLRARLQKVEAGLGRWQGLLRALDASRAAVVEPAVLPYAQETGDAPVQN